MTARIYLRPTAFIDAPFGHDGKAARLAGGLVWFSAVEILREEAGGDAGAGVSKGGGAGAGKGGDRDASERVSAELVPVENMPKALDRLDDAARRAWDRLVAPRPALVVGARNIPLDQPRVAGILNVTPDSFSDGGAYADAAAAVAAGVGMAAAGAALIDAGGESTRPGAQPVWEDDELERVLPVVQGLAASGTAVSIDTRKAKVMAAALGAGAGLVNDVSALTYDPLAMAVVAKAGCPVVLMHHQGLPEVMQDAPHYARPVLFEVYDWLEARIEAAVAAGIARERIIVDPGIGFGKSLRHNLALLNGLALLHGLGCPIMLGASRKRLIGALSGEAQANARLAGSLALALKGAEQGVQLLRVHDVAETVQALHVWRGLRDEALSFARA